MECELRFFGAVSNATESTEAVRVHFDGKSVEDLLVYIQTRWPKTKDFITGSKRGSVVFLLNEKVLNKNDIGKELNEEDKLSIMPFVAGG